MEHLRDVEVAAAETATPTAVCEPDKPNRVRGHDDVRGQVHRVGVDDELAPDA